MELNVEQYKRVVKYVRSKIEGKLEKQDPELEFLSNVLKEHVIRNAGNNKFAMYYQPKYNNENKTHSAEALFRMRNFDGIISTGSFTFVDPEIAFYFIGEVDGLLPHVVKTQVSMICQDASNYQIVNKAGGGDPNYKISLNVPLCTLDKDFVQHLYNNLIENNLKPNNIQIEILETEDFHQIQQFAQAINMLQSIGVTFALDDFGSRNANEYALTALDYDSVKIDKAILDEAKKTNDYSDVANKYHQIKSVHPDSTVVIEGVDGLPDENGDRTKSFHEVLGNLRQIGEMEYQGWGFSKAVPASELSQKIHEQGGVVPPCLGE